MKKQKCHCEEQRDEAIPNRDCHAPINQSNDRNLNKLITENCLSSRDTRYAILDTVPKGGENENSRLSRKF